MSAPAEPSEELTGRMMVTASGPAAFVVVRDWTLTTKAAQRAPVNIAVAPGLYSVNVTRAGGGTQKYVGAVKAGEALTLVFRESAVEERRSSNVFARAAAGLSENLASLFGGTANLASVAPQFGPLQSQAVPPPAIDVRVMTLADWNTAAPLPGVATESTVEEGVPCLIVRCTKDAPIIVQIAEPSNPITNVVVPSRLMNAKHVRIYLYRPLQRWRPRVEIRSQWENLAAAFLSGGNLRAAREVSSQRFAREEASSFQFFYSLTLRFRDIAAISYLPYLALRLGSAEHLAQLPAGIGLLPEQLVTVFHSLPDAHLVAAEFAARSGDHARALRHLLSLPSGTLPIYTDGFSILISRLRAYAAGGEFRPEGISENDAAKAKELLDVMLRWAPYVDFSALTLTFTGSDPAHPGSQPEPDAAASGMKWKTMAIDSKAVDFAEVERQEREQIDARRHSLGIEHKAGALGLALSGGGIRSATFNLGIIQGLTERGLLPHIDYLSTVSGGGYIGAWLHGLIQRHGQGDPRNVSDILQRPEKAPHQESDRDPIQFLRSYSSYLAPDVGLFSADFWSILVIWFRNTTLNQLMLVPFLAAITLVVTFVGVLRASLSSSPAPPGHLGPMGEWAVVAIFVCTLGAVWIVGRGVRSVGLPAEGVPRSGGFYDNNWAAISAVVLLLGAAIGLACMSSTLAGLPAPICFGWMFALLYVLQFLLQWRGGFMDCFQRLHSGHPQFAGLLTIVFPAVAAAATTGLVYFGIRWIAQWEHAAQGSWHVIAWGPALILMLWLIGAGLHIGIMGVDFPDDRREWMARTGAFVNIAVFTWLVLFALCIFGPYWLSSLGVNHGKTLAGLVGGWIATTLGGVFAGKSGKSSGTGEGQKRSPVEWIGKFAPAVFVVGLLMLISFGVHSALRSLTGIRCPECAQASTAPSNPVEEKIDLKVRPDRTVQATVKPPAVETPGWLLWMKPIVDDYWCVLATAPRALTSACAANSSALEWSAIMIGGCVTIVLFFGWRVNINEFSMHHFYKNRLVRCYLGATSLDRRPSRLTGFDASDDFPIETLLARRDRAGGGDLSPYFGPYAIVNGAVNIDRGGDMAKMERKAESFTFTPLYCGFTPPNSAAGEPDGKVEPAGYRATFNYMYPRKGPDIGTCMAISGAAANPNSGYHTSSMVAFLLTMFDVRLGWWVGNPRRRTKSKLPGPRFAPWPLISELCAQTDARASYLNISDGGHFENLGIYELVRRRCRFIVVGDGEQDNHLTFEGLGSAIRKCRADFGVDIEIDPRQIQAPNGLSRTHCVVGRIKYKDCPEGFLLYLKASLTGDEPEDVTQYHSVHTDFPHQPTPNQFFTESQFESYRKLGLHIVDSAFENVHCDEVDLPGIFQSLYNQWYPPSEVSDKVGTRHNDAYSAIVRRIGKDPELQHLLPQVLCGYTDSDLTVGAAGRTAYEERKIFLVCLELIQLMENVWADLHFFDAADAENPKNGGWIRVFHHWAKAEDIGRSWEKVKVNFNPLFRDFFERMSIEKQDPKDPA